MDQNPSDQKRVSYLNKLGIGPEGATPVANFIGSQTPKGAGERYTPIKRHVSQDMGNNLSPRIRHSSSSNQIIMSGFSVYSKFSNDNNCPRNETQVGNTMGDITASQFDTSGYFEKLFQDQIKKTNIDDRPTESQYVPAAGRIVSYTQKQEDIKRRFRRTCDANITPVAVRGRGSSVSDEARFSSKLKTDPTGSTASNFDSRFSSKFNQVQSFNNAEAGRPSGSSLPGIRRVNSDLQIGKFNFRASDNLASVERSVDQSRMNGEMPSEFKSVLNGEELQLEEIEKQIQLRRDTTRKEATTEDPNDVEDYSIVDPDKCYQLTFIKKQGPDLELPLEQKTDDQIRRQYLSKLAYNKIWVTPNSKPRTHQTCIIFDWDDTILCTSFLAPIQGFLTQTAMNLSPTVIKSIRDLDAQGATILAKSIKLGKMFIITNAAQGWVEASSTRFLPKINEILMKTENNVTIISARTMYEKEFPRNYSEWKMRAFLQAQVDLDPEAITNIVALGDSQIELDAAQHLASKYKQAFIKTVKFRESPSPQELTKQLRLVCDQFEQICQAAKNQTVRLQRCPTGSSRASETVKSRPSMGAPVDNSAQVWDAMSRPELLMQAIAQQRQQAHAQSVRN